MSGTRVRETLDECEGFEVVSPNGRVGVVVGLLYADDGTPAALAIRVGLFGHHTLVVDVNEAGRIDRRRRRLSIPVSPRTIEPGAVVRLRLSRTGD